MPTSGTPLHVGGPTVVLDLRPADGSFIVYMGAPEQSVSEGVFVSQGTVCECTQAGHVAQMRGAFSVAISIDVLPSTTPQA